MCDCGEDMAFKDRILYGAEQVCGNKTRMKERMYFIDDIRLPPPRTLELIEQKSHLHVEICFTTQETRQRWVLSGWGYAALRYSEELEDGGHLIMIRRFEVRGDDR
jgi:hypothetical protein